MGTAISYALNQWEPMIAFLDDPGLPPGYNESERRLRRSHWAGKTIFIACHNVGAQNLAELMSLVVSCEANDVNPQLYRSDVLLRIQDHPASQIDDLLPTNWTSITA